MLKKLKQVNYEEKNGKKRVVFLFLLILILILGSVAVMVLIPYLNTFPMYKTFTRTYTTSVLNEESTLTTENTFVVATSNSDGNEEELVFASTDINVELGDYIEPKYIFADRGGLASNASVGFLVKEKQAVDIYLNIYLCDENGENITQLTGEESSRSWGEYYTISFYKEADIFISSVTLSYAIRIK